MNNPLLKLHQLYKSFSNNIVITNLSLEFTTGFSAVLGENGTGKSTLLAIMAGVIPYDKGSLFINGHELSKSPLAAKKYFSYLPDKNLFYPFIKGSEFLHLIANIKKTKLHTLEINKLISDFKLEHYMDIPFKEMSLGTQKKFMLVAAIIGDPPILIMDEPSNALEKNSKEVLINYLQDNVDKKILIVATHDQELIHQIKGKKIVLERHVEVEES
jgi:ABC-2 type transport system ATP-binding protein